MAAKNISRLKQMTESALLDSFSALESNKENSRVNAGISLLRFLYGKQRESKNEVCCPEVNYSLRRLIRGLATSNASKRAGFFSVLVEMLKLFPCIDLQGVLRIKDDVLECTQSSSKKDITEVYNGQTLLVGALIHSNFIFKESNSTQADLLGKLIAVAQKMEILYPSMCSFLIDFIQKTDERHFQQVLWPLLKPELSKSWEHHSLDSLYLLLMTRKLFPEVVRKTLGSKYLICEKSIGPCSKLLMISPFVENHPVYEMVFYFVCTLNFTVPFWEALVRENEQHPSQQKERALLHFLEVLLQQMIDKTQIPELLSGSFMEIIIRTFKMKKMKVELAKKANELFITMSKLLMDDEIHDEFRISFIQRILFYPGNLMFDKLAGTTILVQLSSRMKVEAIVKIGKILRDVMVARKPKIKNAQGETCVWSKWEISCAAQLFTRLLTLPIVEENIKWKLNQLKFLISYGLIVSSSGKQGDIVNAAVSFEVRNCVFKILEEQVSKLDHLITLLTSIVYYLNEIVFLQDRPQELQQPLSDSSVAAWHKMIVAVKDLETINEDPANGKRSSKHMFLVLFLHMGLQLFHSAPLAEEALQELHCCYEKTKGSNLKTYEKYVNKNEESDEPYWVEVIVDLLLSLLSRSSHLLRNLVGVVFPHLCSHLTPMSVHQIVQVLDPHAKQPLSSTDTEGEDDSEDDANKDENSDNDSEVESGSGGDEEDDDDDDDAVDDIGDAPVDVHLKIAVRNALKIAGGGCDSDEESVDMDTMTEEQRNGLDTALSQAFKSLKHNQASQKRTSKKQSKDDETLMHFRVRVIDLLDTYLVNQPALALVLDIILPLFELLEFCIKDNHQKPLENRIRNCLKKLSGVKQFSSVLGVDQELLSVVLRRLLQKGERAAAVYQNMGGPLVRCSTFLARTSHYLAEQETCKSTSKNTPVLDIYKEALTSFFQQRDSLLPLEVFKSVLAITWEGAWILAEAVFSFAFNTDVRPFRRHQSLQLLAEFFSNTRLITDNSPNKVEKLEKLEEKLSENTVYILEEIVNEKKKGKPSEVKEKFIKELLSVLFVVWHTHNRLKEKGIAAAVDWKAVKMAVSHYWEAMSLATDTKAALKKLACALQIGLSKKGAITEQRKSNSQLTHEDDGENDNVSHNSDSDTGDKGYESGNEDKETVPKNTKKRKRPKVDNLKGKALLKKQSKKTRLVAMAEGLDVSLSFAGVDFSKLEELSNETETIKDKRKKKKKEHSDYNDNSAKFSDVPAPSKNLKVKRKDISVTLPRRKKHKVSQ